MQLSKVELADEGDSISENWRDSIGARGNRQELLPTWFCKYRFTMRAESPTHSLTRLDCRLKPCVLTFRAFEGGKNNRSVSMKSILVVFACAAMVLLAVSTQAQMQRPVQTFKSSAGPIKV